LALLLVCGLAATGCRQLFGIDDTDVAGDGAPGDDAAEDGATGDGRRSDAGGDAMQPPVTPCSDTHVVCADFDTPTTGIDLFIESVAPGGTWQEQDDASATSPPSVLLAGVPAGGDLATSGGLRQFGGRRHVVVRASVHVAGLSALCEPFVVSLTTTVDAGVMLGLGVDGYELVTFGAGPPKTIQFGSVAPGVHEIELEVDCDMSRAIARANGATGALVDSQLGGLNEVRYVGAGVNVRAAHGPCTATIDNVVVDEVPP
jgi:hypothetical protein